MKTPRRTSKPKHARKHGGRSVFAVLQPSAGAEAPASGRMHGDSYSDVSAREESLVGTSSTHARRTDRRPEEPSDAAIDEKVIDE